MDWIQYALEALERGQTLEQILATVPSEERAEVQAALEATLWLREKRSALEQAAQRHTPSWDNFAQRLSHRPRPRQAWRWMVALACALFLAVSAWGMHTVAAQALPGDPLYGFKRAEERLRYRFTRGDAARLRLVLTFATTRLQEAESAWQNERPQDAARALQDYLTQLRQAVALAQHLPTPPPGVNQALAQHQTILRRLREGGVPTPAEAQQAMHVLEGLLTEKDVVPSPTPASERKAPPTPPNNTPPQAQGTPTPNTLPTPPHLTPGPHDHTPGPPGGVPPGQTRTPDPPGDTPPGQRKTPPGRGHGR